MNSVNQNVIKLKVGLLNLATELGNLSRACKGDLLNDRVLPFFAERGMGVIRILTDRGTEFCGKAESHD
jgi:hypothetical protein